MIAVAVLAVVVGVAGFAFAGGGLKPAGESNNKPMVMHIHPKLSLSMDGRDIAVPQNIGIDNSLWKGHSLDQYGMQGMSPLHTHDTSGIIHVESNVQRDFTLGEFLDVWGGIDPSKIASVAVDGNEVSDYSNHILSNGENIRLEITS